MIFDVSQRHSYTQTEQFSKINICCFVAI